MRKLVVSEFLTLDGVLQSPGDPDEDTEGGFTRGGWQRRYMDEVAGAVLAEGMAAADALLLGRKTYEMFAAYWPTASEGPGIADYMNSVAKYVASTTLERVTWQNSTLIKGDVADEVTRLKNQPGKNISLVGSGDLAQTLIRHDLVDEYVLLIHPVVVGGGKRLFADASGVPALQLVDSATTGTGVAILTYRRAE
jgi:dihydrofolate reductase